MLYDAAVIGTGPAGLSAALNLRLHNKSIVWFGSRQMSGSVGKSERIRNYPGFPEITGEELNRRMQEQARFMELEITECMVTNAMPSADTWMLLAGNEIYQARVLLLAAGMPPAKGFPGENELLGRGVSYCATCDGYLYQGKTIAVFCGSRRFEHEVADLAGFAETLYLQTAYPDDKSEGVLAETGNIHRLSRPIRRVLGRERIEGIELGDGSRIAVDGLFCLRESVAPAALLPGLAMEGAHIAVSRGMETNLPGCYAAGDCTGRPYQIAKAVGEGNVAAHSMLAYLAR